MEGVGGINRNCLRYKQLGKFRIIMGFIFGCGKKRVKFIVKVLDISKHIHIIHGSVSTIENLS